MAGRSKKLKDAISHTVQDQSHIKREGIESQTVDSAEAQAPHRTLIDSLPAQHAAYATEQIATVANYLQSDFTSSFEQEDISTPEPELEHLDNTVFPDVEQDVELHEADSFSSYDPRSLHDSLYGTARQERVAHKDDAPVHTEYAPLSYISQNPLVSKLSRVNHEREVWVGTNTAGKISQVAESRGQAYPNHTQAQSLEPFTAQGSPDFPHKQSRVQDIAKAQGVSSPVISQDAQANVRGPSFSQGISSSVAQSISPSSAQGVATHDAYPSSAQEMQFYQRQIGLGDDPLDFSKYYVESESKPKCVDLYLTYNYRSQASILSAAFDVISKNTDVVRRPLLAKRQDIDLSQMVTLIDPNADAVTMAEAKNKIMETFQQKGALTHVSERRKRVVETLNTGKRLKTAEHTKGEGNFFQPEPPLSTMKPVIVHVPSVESEAQFVIKTIQDIQQLDEQASIAVLYRTHYAVTKIEDELLRAEIPYRVVGAVSFFERKEIQDALAYMRLRVNPDDDMALRRVINVPSRKFGAKRMELLESLARKGQCSLFQALLRNSDNEKLFARNQVNNFVQGILELNDEPLKDAAHDFELVMAKSGYEEWLKVQGEDERLDHLAELKQHVVDYVANQGENVNLADFLYSVMLLTDADDVNRNRREVQLMTVHCSKGLEFDYVFIISANEAIFPSRQAVSSNNIDEERRLMYVAMTRARKQLIISEAGGCVYMYLPGTLLNCQSQTVKLERKPSRFLREIKEGHFAELGAHILEQKEAATNRHAHLQSADTHVHPYQEVMNALRASQSDDGGMLTTQGQHKGFKYPEGAIVKHPVFGEGRIETCNEQEGEYEIFFTQLNRRRNITAIVGNRNLTLVSMPSTCATPPAVEQYAQNPAPDSAQVQSQAAEQSALDEADYYTPENLPQMPPEFYEAEELAFSLDDPNRHDS